MWSMMVLKEGRNFCEADSSKSKQDARVGHVKADSPLVDNWHRESPAQIGESEIGHQVNANVDLVSQNVAFD